jgi:diguanylate cyclase (GGDEF)-like protein
MPVFLKKQFIIIILVVLFPLYSIADDVVIGVRAIRGVNHAIGQWTPTIDYLQLHLPQYNFTLRPVAKIANMQVLVKTNQVDFIITQPVAYVDLERLYGASRVLTLQKKNNVTQFGSVIISQYSRSDILSLNDTKGKTVAGVTKKGFGGWLIGYELLMSFGINFDDSQINFLGTQDKVVNAVVNAEVDIGVVRTGIIEKMMSEGRLGKEKIKILHQVDRSEYPFKSSTRLYPEWAFAKNNLTTDALAKKVSMVLLTIEENSDAARKGEYAQWVMPLSYNSVHQLMKKLKVGSYSEYGEVTLKQFLQQHWYSVVLILMLILLMFIYIFQVRRSHFLLMQETQKKREALTTLEHMATHDSLTGLPNRHIIYALIDKQISLCLRNKYSLAILFIDLDGFKLINDTYGHELGDDVLRDVTKIIQSKVRNTDICGRLGGDEFIVSLYNIDDIHNLANIANAIIDGIVSLNAYKNETHKISASIGGVISNCTNVTTDKLISAADELMYNVKNNGKGRCELSFYEKT